MMIELEKFHKEQTRLKERNEHRELDLRYYKLLLYVHLSDK